VTIYDQDEPTIAYWEECDFPGNNIRAKVTPRSGQHFRGQSRHPLAKGVAIGLLIAVGLAGLMFGAVYAVRPQHPAVVRLRAVSTPPTTITPPTTAAAPTTAVQAATTTTVQPGPPMTIMASAQAVPNPVMTKVPGVIYTAQVYPGAPQMGFVAGDHPGVVDPDGRSVSQYLAAMGLPAGTRVAVVGSVVVGYVP